MYRYLNFKLSGELRKLQKTIIEKIGIQRDGFVREKYYDSNYMNELNKDEKRMALNIALLGYSQPTIHT